MRQKGLHYTEHLIALRVSCPLQGAVTGCGTPSLWSQQPTAASHASVVHKLLNKGVSIIGQASTQPFNYPSLGDNMRNPAARFRVAGGGATGAVAAVAQQQAQLGVGTDWLGSLTVPAACQGVPALVCTPGVYKTNNSSSSSSNTEQATADGATAAVQASSNGSSSSRSQSGGSTNRSSNGLEAAAFAARDFGVMRRVAEQLALPGVSDLRGALTQVVVAEDLFSLCDAHMDTGGCQQGWGEGGSCKPMACWRALPSVLDIPLGKSILYLSVSTTGLEPHWLATYNCQGPLLPGPKARHPFFYQQAALAARVLPLQVCCT